MYSVISLLQKKKIYVFTSLSWSVWYLHERMEENKPNALVTISDGSRHEPSNKWK